MFLISICSGLLSDRAIKRIMNGEIEQWSVEYQICGFLGANITYRLFLTFEHRYLFMGSSLVTLVFILAGQTIVEHVFQTQTTLSVVINFIGGLYFIFLLLKERSEM